nr:hypothetical protein [Paludibacteraceae bacterium]
SNVLQQSMKVVESMNLPLDDEYYTQMEKMMKPSVYTLQSIWVNVLLGALLALVMSAFVKKDKDIFEE